MDFPSSTVQNPCQKDRAELTKQQAIDRSYQVLNIVYFLEINLQKFASAYSIKTQINFDYNPNANKTSSLKLEYSGKYMNSLQINDMIVAEAQIHKIWHDNYIEIPIQSLLTGRNMIFICTKNEYSTDGTSLFSYTEDSKQYIYSLMAPNNCHKIFPCFDQPTLKAHFFLQLIVPTKWVCISNEDPIHIYKVSDEISRWFFEPKTKISTYLLAIIAGDFKSISYPIENCQEKIQLRLYFKQTAQAESEQSSKEIFELINFGIKFYSEYFQIPFPFSKYDQIFCPEFNFLGMENPGAVCLTDSYLFWDPVTSCKRTARCLTILHELAHMWFGNLVTMKWWDDVWLNESFAVYISHYCLEKLNKSETKLSGLYSDSMVRFFFYKRDGYEEDSIAETTHPISQIIQSTEQSSLIFNSITYSKGAAVIKQLMYMINEKVFGSSLKQYFEKFSWGNADLDDFVEVIEGNVLKNQENLLKNHSFQEWKTEWLQWASLNVMNIEEIVGEKRFIRITQEPISQVFPFIRTHFFKLCVYYLKDEEIKEKIIEVHIKETMVEVEILLEEGVEQYGILMNYEDHGYFKTNLDVKSMEFFKKKLFFINNKLSKALILLNFFDLIFENSDFSAFDFLDIIQRIISDENDVQLLNQCLNYASRIIENFLPEALKTKGATEIFKILYDFLKEKTTNPDKILVIKEYLGLFAKNLNDIEKLLLWLLQKNPEIKHIAVNSYMLTQSIELIFMRKLLNDSERKELQKKFVENNKYYNLFCEYTLMTLEQKMKAYDRFLDPKSTQDSVYLMSFAMKGFNNEWDKASSEVFEKKFFENVEKVFKNCNNQYAKTFFRRLFPRNENLRRQIGWIEEILKRKGDEVLEFLLKEKLQNLKQKLKVFNWELKRFGMEEV